MIKQKVVDVLSWMYYPFFKAKRYQIMSIDETINFMCSKGHSIIRFGDGEFSLLNGRSIEKYQPYSESLKKGLVTSVTTVNKDDLLICLPETMRTLDFCVKKSRAIWKRDFFRNRKSYGKYCKNTIVYGNAFVSRPYMIYEDKTKCEKWFRRIIDMFQDKKIVIIEGEYSRCGVGNNFLENAHSVKRILCPSENAFAVYDRILFEAKKIEKDSLILLSIGPASKPLALELFNVGYWVWDIGHIDSEYEWFLSNAQSKEKIVGKHTAEMQDNEVDIGICENSDYNNSIIVRIS